MPEVTALIPPVLKQSLTNFILANPEATGKPHNGQFPNIVVDVSPKVRLAVCRALRARLPLCWIIVTPQTEEDRFVPAAANARGPTAQYRSTLQRYKADGLIAEGWEEDAPDVLATDHESGRPARGVWRVPAKLPDEPPAWLVRLGALVRRLGWCSRKRHRTEIQLTSAFVIFVCRDCDKQVDYRSR